MDGAGTSKEGALALLGEPAALSNENLVVAFMSGKRTRRADGKPGDSVCFCGWKTETNYTTKANVGVRQPPMCLKVREAASRAIPPSIVSNP